MKKLKRQKENTETTTTFVCSRLPFTGSGGWWVAGMAIATLGKVVVSVDIIIASEKRNWSLLYT
jgi:hypothetical protein